MRMLIADSDCEFLDIAKRFMNQYGHEALVASNGLECIACLRESAPDILVLDSELLWGGSDGVREIMNEEPQLDSIPVILIADEEQSATPDCEPSLRVVDRIKKPYSLTQLIKRIQAVGRDCQELRLRTT